jgi:hypothetical protein
MKMREVILRAIARKITWDQAADVLAISPAAMARLRRLYQRRGYDGHWVRASRKTFSTQVPFATVERLLLLYQQRYSGFDARAFHKRLRSRHGIDLRYPLLAQILQEAGLLLKTGDLQHSSVAAQTASKNSRFS